MPDPGDTALAVDAASKANQATVATARAAAPPVMPADYGYVPDPSYVRKNWAPEKVSDEDLRALAKAQALAVHHGVLNPSVAEYFLANALVEGRFSDYGENGLYAKGSSDPYAKHAKAMDVKPDPLSIEPFSLPSGKQPGSWWYRTKGRDDTLVTPEDRAYNARLAAVELASKGSDPKTAYTRWNGKGKGTIPGTTWRPPQNYDADNHWRKVDAQHRALKAVPQNKALWVRYQSLLAQEAEAIKGAAAPQPGGTP